MSDEVSAHVRPYRPEDRAAVRQICWDTAFMGQSMEFLYRDRESWTDLFTRYYTDHEPEGSFVACDASGQVIGYLLGANDTRRLNPFYLFFVFRHLLLRMCLLRPGSAGFWWRLAWDMVRDLFDSAREPPYDHGRFPAEMHINLLPSGRSSGAARDLVQAWYAHLRRCGVPGAHGNVLANNERSLRFLEKNSYVRTGKPYLVPGLRDRDGSRLYAQQVLSDLGGPE